MAKIRNLMYVSFEERQQILEEREKQNGKQTTLLEVKQNGNISK